MNSKLISKLLNYAKAYGFSDLSITKHADHHILWADDGLDKTQIKLPLKLERDLATAFKQLLQIAPTDLLSGTYFKADKHSFLISIIPHEEGEKIVIKIVDKSLKNFKLSKIGLERSDRKIIEAFLKRRQGLALIASPANEGKTSTLYALLSTIDTDKRICYLSEENAELEIDGVNKLVGRGARRASDLEKIRQHDSDVIAIDDADEGLLKQAYSIAQQGKMVLVSFKAENLSSLNSELEKIKDGKDIPTLTIFQKLLSKNCPYCLKDYISDEATELIDRYWPSSKNYKPIRFFNARGCRHCNHSGKKGLIAVFSIIKADSGEKESVKTISADILQKAANGLISLNKFLRKQKESLSHRL